PSDFDQSDPSVIGGTPVDMSHLIPTGPNQLPSDGEAADPDHSDQGSSAAAASFRDSARFRTAGAGIDLNQLEDAYEKLGTLYAFMHAISRTIKRTELLELIAAKILEIFPQGRSVGVYLKNTQDVSKTSLTLCHFAGPEGASSSQRLGRDLSPLV